MIDYAPRVGFTGSRHLAQAYQPLVQGIVESVILCGLDVAVGDASGLDTMVYESLMTMRPFPAERFEVFLSKSKKAHDLVNRSTDMVNSIVQSRRKRSGLIGFVTEECPEGVEPKKTFYGNGSGTWGTIAYATYWNLPIALIGLDIRAFQPPAWFSQWGGYHIDLAGCRVSYYYNYPNLLTWYGLDTLRSRLDV